MKSGFSGDLVNRRTNTKRPTLLVVLLLSLTIAGCGASQASQCKKMFLAMGDAVSDREPTQDLSHMAELSGKATANLEALKIRDKKLNNLRLHLVAAFREATIVTGDFASRAGSSGQVDIDPDDPLIARMQAAGKRLIDVQKALYSYCGGETIDPSLTSPPKETPRR